jgi:hypothetical protein
MGDRDRGRGFSRGSSRGGFEYRQRDPSAVQKRSEGGGNFDSFIKSEVKLFTPHDGDNTIRIVPPTWDDAQHYGVDIYVHYNVGPDNEAYACLKEMKGERCPICEERAEAQRKGDTEYADSLKPSRRVGAFIVDRDNEKDGVLLWTMPFTIDRDICKLVQDKRTGEVLAIDSPYEGYDVEFTREGKGQRTKYVGIMIARRSSELGDDDWLEYAKNNPIPEIIQYYSYEHIQSKFSGGGAPRDEDRSSRGRDDDRGSSRNSQNPTWDDVHGMTFDDMVDLISDKNLDIDPDKSKDDEDLADWICEELKIKKEDPPPRRRSSGDDDADSGESRLGRMSRRRSE